MNTIKNTYIVTLINADENGYFTVSLKNSAGNFGGVITNDQSFDHYVENCDQLMVGDSIDI